jgi:hypothetical protein
MSMSPRGGAFAPHSHRPLFLSTRRHLVRTWTVLLIPHDTEEPRSIAVSERLLRVAAAMAVVMLFAAVIGIGTVAGRWARPDRTTEAMRRSAMFDAGAAGGSGELDSLRATVEALYHVLDTIRQSDAQLSEAAGVGHVAPDAGANRASIAVTRATADSLLHGASQVAKRLVALADSARQLRGATDTAGRKPSTVAPAPKR